MEHFFERFQKDSELQYGGEALHAFFPFPLQNPFVNH